MHDKNNLQQETAPINGSLFTKTISWLFGTVVLAIAVVNTFWGNDPGFGIFIVLLSLVYFLPVNEIFKKLTGFYFPRIGIAKFALGLFIIWAALGVGELFDKIVLMRHDLFF